jgi:hypothetical protein
VVTPCDPSRAVRPVPRRATRPASCDPSRQGLTRVAVLVCLAPAPSPGSRCIRFSVHAPLPAVPLADLRGRSLASSWAIDVGTHRGLAVLYGRFACCGSRPRKDPRHPEFAVALQLTILAEQLSHTGCGSGSSASSPSWTPRSRCGRSCGAGCRASTWDRATARRRPDWRVPGDSATDQERNHGKARRRR